MTYNYIIAPDTLYLSIDNSPIYWPVSEANLILYKKIKQNKHMAKQKFKPGDKVKFTQEAKDRFNDNEYWKCANYRWLDLDRVYTVKGYDTKDRPSYSLEEEGTAPNIADYLLEPAEEQTKKKNMTKTYSLKHSEHSSCCKKDFILALVQVIFPDQDLTYEGCKPYAKVCIGIDTVTVKCPKDKKGNVNLTLSPMYGYFEKTDIEPITEFLTQNCDLDCGKNNIKVTDNGDLVIYFADYPWNMIEEIKSSTSEEPKEEDKPGPCDNCKVVRKLQAEIQRLKYELDQAKAEKPQTKARALDAKVRPTRW